MVDCATLRNTRGIGTPIVVVFTLATSSFWVPFVSADSRTAGRKKHERTLFRSSFFPVSVSLPFSLPRPAIRRALSLSLSRPPAGFLSHSFFIDSGLFVSFTPNGRAGRPCPTDEFIFVHAFRLRRQEIYAKSRSVRRIFERHGDYSYRWSLDEVLTASSLLASRTGQARLWKYFSSSLRDVSRRCVDSADFSV